MYGNSRRSISHSHTLNSFAAVEDKYNKTKPLVSKNHTVSQDVRPVGERRRKWERVKKISDDCYIVLSGYGYEDDVFSWRGFGTIISVEEQVALAAICWQRDAQGVETIKIRNGTGDHAHTSHYRFLEEALPRGLEFHIKNGKQFVSVVDHAAVTKFGAITNHASDPWVKDTYYLPKTRYVPKRMWDYWTNQNTPGAARALEYYSSTEDGAFLTFTRTGTHTFKFSGELHTIPKPPRHIVDKELKDRYKQPIAEYLEWINAIAPLLRIDDWEYCNTMRKEVYDYAQGRRRQKAKRRIYRNSSVLVPPGIMLEVVTEPDHPLRLHMALDFVENYRIIQHVKSQDDIKTVRTQYNRWINKQCGFLKLAA